MIRVFTDFLKLEAAGGIVLMLAAVAAMAMANSGYAFHYDALLGWRPEIGAGGHVWAVPFPLLINDGLMPLFFLLVGLEIKREVIEGELSTRAKAMLPVCAALGGVLLPAGIYLMYNGGSALARGWAIPSATDIAFSLGVLSLFGRRVKPSLTVFLMALAVIDDLAAILIIAVFYTAQLHVAALMVAAACAVGLAVYSRKDGARLLPYLLVGMVIWAAVLASGVHATVAGVLVAWLIPLRLGKSLIHRLHPWVAFGVLPLFAFVNSGVALGGISMAELMSPVPLGIALGLFAGKQAGIFGTAWLLVRLRLASLPEKASWGEFYGVCILAGIGFTMSLFIGLLAFDDTASHMAMRLGVITGSLLSVLAGSIVLFGAMRGK